MKPAYLIAYSVLDAEEPRSMHFGVHGVSLPEAVWRDLTQWGLPTYEWGLHQAGGDD